MVRTLVASSLWTPFVCAFALASVFATTSLAGGERVAADAVANSWAATGALAYARAGHSATLLRDGRVLVSGGPVVEIYDPMSGQWSFAAPMPQAQSGRAVLLPNGEVLIGHATFNLYDPASDSWRAAASRTATTWVELILMSNGKVLAVGRTSSTVTSEIYDPGADTWQAAAAPQFGGLLVGLASGQVMCIGGSTGARSQIYTPATNSWASPVSLQYPAPDDNYSATRLPNGKVLVAGGYGGYPTVAMNGAQLWDPNTGAWTVTDAMSYARMSHTATVLPNGKVLVAGGHNMINYSGSYVSYAEAYDPATGQWTNAGTLATPRTASTLTLLTTGRVLLAGGVKSTSTSDTVYANCDLYDSRASSWTATGTLGAARYLHTSTLLPSGDVLAAGGADGYAGASSEIYDTTSGVWVSGPTLATPRQEHTATLMPLGKVLLAGGWKSASPAAVLESAELYDPDANAFVPTGSMGTARRYHTATLLPSEKVLVVGGANDSTAFLSSVETYDPASQSWSPAAAMQTARRRHTTTLLPNGRLLVTGGEGSSGTLASAEIYDPTTNSWSPTSPMGTARKEHAAIVLATGKVLVAGGSALSTAELYDPSTGTWTATGTLGAIRSQHTLTLLRDGSVIAAGGYSGSAAVSRVDRYDSDSGSWNTMDASSARRYHTATLLPTGNILLAGGFTTVALNSSQLFTANAFPAARRPTITAFPSSFGYGNPLTLTGTGFRGDTEANAGTSVSSAHNYPLFQLLSVENQTLTPIVADAATTFWDDPMTVAISSIPLSLPPGWYLLTAITTGVPSESVLVDLTCRLAVTQQPSDQTVSLGTSAVFSIETQLANGLQWQKNGIDIPFATQSSYTTPPVTGADSGAKYRCRVTGNCAVVYSDERTLTVSDSSAPQAAVTNPAGGEYWLLSTASAARKQVVSWTMTDDVRICRVAVSLQHSDDGGGSWTDSPAPNGLSATFGAGGSCSYPGVLTTSLTYDVPTVFPSDRAGSLYRIRVVVRDQVGNETSVTSPNPFYIVQANPDSVRTLILWNRSRMVSFHGMTPAAADQLASKLQELANHPRVQGVVVDLGGVTSIASLYAAWDANPADRNAANAVLFGAGGIHEHLRSDLVTAYGGVKYLVVVGDDRIIPMARVRDRTSLLPESSYTDGDDLSPLLTTVGQALAADQYLSDDPLAVLDVVSTDQLDGSLYIPDLGVGRLVETPAQIAVTIANYIGNDGVLDLSLLDPVTGHKVLVTGYDFLTNAAIQMRARWKNALGISTSHASTAPVDGSLVGGNWGLGSVALRTAALRNRLAGNGGARYGVVALAGHATHYEEGVPGTNPFDIQGLSTLEIYGPDACAGGTQAIDLSGAVIYAVGCHGGLPVPGSCHTDANHSLDLPETMLARGAVAYVANTGYGWGLKYGIGYGSRLVQIFTEQMTSGGTIAVGDAVRKSKQRYFLEAPRYDAYDEKSLMQWTLFGLPMYAVKSGAGSGSAAVVRPTASNGAEELLGAVRVRKSFAGSSREARTDGAATTLAMPSYLTQLSLSFDFTADGLYVKHDSAGNVLPPGPGCPDANGCYYTLNGIVDRGTGSSDLPIQPYLIYDSRLSGSSQHGVLWKGGTYDEEANWKPVIAELLSNGAEGSNHGAAPRKMMTRPTAPRLVPGVDSPSCRPADVELNTLTIVAGEAVKPEDDSPGYTIARRYRTTDLEVFYFNNTAAPNDNCDRSGPDLGAGPYHQVSPGANGSTVSWTVGASDPAGVWRVVVVYTTNTIDGDSRGTWVPLELVKDGTGSFRGSVVADGTSRVTYVIQAVDRRGNVTWLDFAAAQLPSSGVPLSVALAVDVNLGASATVPTNVLAAAQSATSVSITWSGVSDAVGYEVYRRAAGTAFAKVGSTVAASFADPTVQAGRVYLYAVASRNASGVASALSSPDLASTITFTDPTLGSTTLVKGVHLTELRAAADAARELAAQNAYPFTDTSIQAGVTLVRAVHLLDLRNAVAQARAGLFLPSIAWTDAPPSVIRATHVIQLRDALR